MAAGTIQATTPFCRSCGWDFVAFPNLDDDFRCDACGDDLRGSLTVGVLDPPTSLSAAGGSLDVTFTWTDEPSADTTDLRHQTDGGAWTTIVSDTSPAVIVAADGEVVNGQVRSVTSGVTGPWSAADSDAATA
jgi:hypothetical protein